MPEFTQQAKSMAEITFSKDALQQIGKFSDEIFRKYSERMTPAERNRFFMLAMACRDVVELIAAHEKEQAEKIVKAEAEQQAEQAEAEQAEPAPESDLKEWSDTIHQQAEKAAKAEAEQAEAEQQAEQAEQAEPAPEAEQQAEAEANSAAPLMVGQGYSGTDAEPEAKPKRRTRRKAAKS
jgi:hypothetical protein